VRLAGSGQTTYNRGMARGWESKGIESQQADMAQTRKLPDAKGPDPAYLELIRKKETLLLSRTRIVREIGNCQNPRYREMLGHALENLDAQLNALAEATGRAHIAAAS
jgi:hypothetical protein